MIRVGAWLVLVGLALGACSAGLEPSIVLASSPEGIGVGHQRVLVAVTDLTTGDFLAAPEVGVTGTLRTADGSPIDESTGLFLWAVPGTSGVYAFEFDVPEPDTFQVTVRSDEWGDLGPIGLIASDNPTVVGIGDVAPRSETRTAATHPIESITSDPNPQPSFYELSVADAVEAGPAVVVFATFIGCEVGACGTLLDQVKVLAPRYPDLSFVHVEIYEDLAAVDLSLDSAVSEWGLPSEPWVFVVDDTGVVRARMEGAAANEELQTSFDLVAVGN